MVNKTQYDVCRCDGWAQCPLCPRPDNPRFPADCRGDPRCAPRPRPYHSCPTTGVHCHQNRACCSRLLGCGNEECLEFIPSWCSRMSAINCTPNLPPSGWSVLGWRPGPPGMRTCPRTQYPSSPCSMIEPPELPCRRPCDARDLKSPPRPVTIRYVPDKPWPISQPPCNPPPPVPPYTCRAIGSRRLTEHIQFKYSYPGQFRFFAY